MSVYFVLAPDLGRVKIGYAENPRSRLNKMRSDSPARLVLRAVVDGDMGNERDLHAKFSAQRLHGEWFSYDGELRGFIDALPHYQTHRKRKELAGPLGKWMAENSHSVRSFGEAIGITAGQISRICAGHSIPSKDLMRAIYEKTNGQVSPNDFYGVGEAA
jgi:hypothetical protein